MFGNYILDGYAGTDILIGGLGNDTYLVNLKQTGTITAPTVALEDTITETAVLNSGIDTVQLSGTFNLIKATSLTLGLNLENLDASGTGNTNGAYSWIANSHVREACLPYPAFRPVPVSARPSFARGQRCAKTSDPSSPVADAVRSAVRTVGTDAY